MVKLFAMPTSQDLIHEIRCLRVKIRSDLQAYASIAKVQRCLVLLEQPMIFPSHVPVIREALTHVLSIAREEDKQKIHQCLLKLAASWSINANDVATLSPIPPESRVVISTGHQFDIKSLAQWHNSRSLMCSLHEEFKRLINPFTNQPMSALDAQHVLSVAGKLEITFKDACFWGIMDDVDSELGFVDHDDGDVDLFSAPSQFAAPHSPLLFRPLSGTAEGYPVFASYLSAEPAPVFAALDTPVIAAPVVAPAGTSDTSSVEAVPESVTAASDVTPLESSESAAVVRSPLLWMASLFLRRRDDPHTDQDDAALIALGTL